MDINSKSLFALFEMRRLEYKNKIALSKYDFIIFIFCDLIIQLLSVVFLYGVYQRVEVIRGWNLEQALFLLGTYQLSMGLFAVLFWPLYDISDIIISGEMDSYLLRPVPLLAQLLLKGIGDIGGIIAGGCLVVFYHSGIHNIRDVMIYFVSLILAVILLVCIHSIIAATSFWMERSSDVLVRLYSEISNFSKYPITIYSAGIKFACTWLVPIGFLGYYPVAYLIGKEDYSYILKELVVVFVFLLITKYLWKKGTKKYRGIN